MVKKQTAGRENLGEFAPKFAELNDDVLFGEVWSREEQMSLHDRSLITVSSLLTQGVPQLEAHMKIAKQNGVSKNEMVELITHLSFYTGWPKAWTAFEIAKEIYGDNE
ncbi:gamma-carboxymuconolactone decarboxylase subunit-like protein [Paucilactobacillus oligofermentans DSM 15707 = LMG 22743]|uniref:Gamma-carboxymuconolactone decarboxylase subunit-like protein n=1 Tax=Paucilactobacillus oligofermentans DSM 15707 = LMG 22743 TaxID=1423778 RepID=A0A0R1RE76_9LACO|nr:carboxymuconolactone decarboxylase family protein [Paucilactobacillus oligofermentans]KRL54681.1 gamma-carboxymuconolactone decarboxylase subunit-like protein [Paucilactobacillus oligofermentans DSM 15707 = LMG 22743]CUS26409.1 Carboxymuconolactone decarboxylase family protein [Paucilactobacillus oligofermentans DSM 15707 = LMG 22743]